MSNTYYSNCGATVGLGCYLYNDPPKTDPVSAGYYSDGVYTFHVTGTTGKVISKINCSGGGGTSGTLNCACFVGDTLINLIGNEQTTINNIKLGDVVMSYNVTTKKMEPNKVLEIFSKSTEDLIKYTFENGTTIISTEDHPFYVNGFNIASYDPIKTFEDYELNSEQIKIGDIVNLSTDITTEIVDIQEYRENNKVYTFVVENNHNYYANNVLVHNKRLEPVCCSNGTSHQNTNKVDGCPCLGSGWIETPGAC
jgi:hypothetical protein